VVVGGAAAVESERRWGAGSGDFFVFLENDLLRMFEHMVAFTTRNYLICDITILSQIK
jgi:hypothetical protein